MTSFDTLKKKESSKKHRNRILTSFHWSSYPKNVGSIQGFALNLLNIELKIPLFNPWEK
jgi:hypothetical protein